MLPIDWPPPDLNKLKGKQHRQARNADDGAPMLWIWQVTGVRWNLNAVDFNLESKAWRRLAALLACQGERT